MAFDLDKSYSFDKVAAEEGVKMQVGQDKEEYILICRLPNKAYTLELTKVMQDNSRKLDFLKEQDEDAFMELDRELQAGVLAKTVITGWGTKIVIKGKKLTYSVKTCAETLLEYPDFRADCVEFASDRANYPAKMDVEEVKKS